MTHDINLRTTRTATLTRIDDLGTLRAFLESLRDAPVSASVVVRAGYEDRMAGRTPDSITVTWTQEGV